MEAKIVSLILLHSQRGREMSKINRVSQVLIFLLNLVITSTVFAAYDDYTAFPPFLSSAVPPNVLLVLDQSGSMGWEAYNGGYDSTITYEGYFVPDSVYEYNSSGDYWQESTSSADSCPTNGKFYYSGLYTGTCFNYYWMARVDLLRWSLTGGRPETCTGTNDSSTCDADLACTGTTCVLAAYYGINIEVPKSRVDGILQEFEDKTHRPRFGVLFYDDVVMGNSVYIGDYYNGNDASVADGPYTYTKRFINAVNPSGATAAGPALEEAYDYFKQFNDHSGNNSPFNFADTTDTTTAYCDPLNICDEVQDNCSSAPCMKNFVIFVSDGEWNTGADPVIPSYQIHTDILRTLDSIDVSVESVFSLGLFLSGNGERALKHVAMYGSFDTTNRTWPGGTTTYPNTSLTTNIPSPSFPDWDADNDGSPDTFFSAQNAGEIKESLKKYIYNVLKQSSAGSAVSILSERTVSGSAVHQALFYPSKYYNTDYKVDWTGVLNAYWFYNSSQTSNIREDNVNNFYLDLLDDHPLDFLINSRGALTIDYYGTESNGATDFTTGALGTYSSVEEVSKVWEGGDKLRARAGSDRLIYGIDESDTMSSFTLANITNFDSLLGTDTNMNACLSDTATERPGHLVQYIRGEQDDFFATSGGCRTRVVNAAGDIWKLGDTVSSTPKVVNYDFIKDIAGTPTAVQHGVLYLGSNDGMLHAFHVGEIRKDGLGADQVARLCDKKTGDCDTVEIGNEMWAFIPKNSMPYLRYLADPDYQHMYSVDMAPYLIEDNDKKILIGGMRFGGATGCVTSTGVSNQWCGDTDGDGVIDVDADGDAKMQIVPPSDVCSVTDPANCLGFSSYFAIDITDPYDPIFLWEFTNKDLGFSYSGPAFIKRTLSDGTTNRYITFLSGPLNYKGFAEGQDLNIFVLKVDGNFNRVDANGSGTVTNDDVYIIQDNPSITNAYGARLFTEGIDVNSDGNTDLLAFGINWRSGGSWHGNSYVLAPDDSDPCISTTCANVNWEFTQIFAAAHEPITGKVDYSPCFGYPFIYYGTGRWLYKNDSPGLGALNQNGLYGVNLEDCANNLLDGDSTTSCADGLNINAAMGGASMCNADGTLNTTGSSSWQIKDLAEDDADYMEERTISDPTVTSYDLVFFTTTQPSSNLCAFGGQSRLWGLNCLSGHAMNDGCTGYIPVIPNTALLLQLSGGNIEDARLDEAFTEEGGLTTDWYKGIPPESGATFPEPTEGLSGEIILWIER